MPESDYEWLDRMNLCHRCRKERPAPGRKFCFDCLDKIREENARRYDPGKAREYQARRRELYRQKKTAGICVRCSKPATHGIYCYDHLIAAKRHNRETAERRKMQRHERGLIPEKRVAAGLCPRCGAEKPAQQKYCDDCMKQLTDALNHGRDKSPFRSMERQRYSQQRLRRHTNGNSA